MEPTDSCEEHGSAVCENTLHLGLLQESSTPKECGFYPRAMRGHEANRNWEQRLPEAYAMQPPFAQNWKRGLPIMSRELAKTIQTREAKTQGQRPLAAPGEGPVQSVLSTANLSVPFLARLHSFLHASLSTKKKLKKGKSLLGLNFPAALRNTF